MGIIIGLIGVAATAYYGIKQHTQGKKDTIIIKSILDTLDKKVDGIAIYKDGLAAMPEKRRRSLLSTGLEAMRDYKYNEAINYFRECLGSGTKQSEKVALLILIGNCFLSTGRREEAQGSYKEAEKIAREDNNNEGLSAALGNIGIACQFKGELDKAPEPHQ